MITERPAAEGYRDRVQLSAGATIRLERLHRAPAPLIVRARRGSTGALRCCQAGYLCCQLCLSGAGYDSGGCSESQRRIRQSDIGVVIIFTALHPRDEHRVRARGDAALIPQPDTGVDGMKQCQHDRTGCTK